MIVSIAKVAIGALFGTPSGQLRVRCHVDRLLISRLPASHPAQARMPVRGLSSKPTRRS
ncbi:hypothetical protein BTK96_001789 [Burkholderia pyrrocinia]|uniref:hypothetical protein n=1 Tax=Burkholderia sp. IT-111MI5 TaxID=3026439 RepID=UPI002A3395A3|nr:hypothetical protein [Burkholderia pyrrocinia]EKS9892993.1 hypothetical protein [Burkholderia pyrrocinia]EKS9905501.1 hypothetical protein [Burkholderia pyrrocinia]